MKSRFWILAAALTLSASVACSDDEGNEGDTGTNDVTEDQGGDSTEDATNDMIEDATPDMDPDMIEGDADATEGDADATEGDADATEGDADAVEGDADAVEGDADAVEGDGDAVEGDADAIEGGDADVIEGGDADVIEGGDADVAFDGGADFDFGGGFDFGSDDGGFSFDFGSDDSGSGDGGFSFDFGGGGDDAGTTPDATFDCDGLDAYDITSADLDGEVYVVEATFPAEAGDDRYLPGEACAGAGGGDDGYETYFTFTAPSDGLWTIDTLTPGATPAAGDTQIQVFSDTCTGPRLGCNDDAPGGGLLSGVNAELAADQTVFILVEPWGLGDGNENFVLRISRAEAPTLETVELADDIGPDVETFGGTFLGGVLFNTPACSNPDTGEQGSAVFIRVSGSTGNTGEVSAASLYSAYYDPTPGTFGFFTDPVYFEGGFLGGIVAPCFYGSVGGIPFDEEFDVTVLDGIGQESNAVSFTITDPRIGAEISPDAGSFFEVGPSDDGGFTIPDGFFGGDGGFSFDSGSGGDTGTGDAGSTDTFGFGDL